MESGTQMIKVKFYYRYVSKSEAEIIRRAGEIPHVNPRGEPKEIYITDTTFSVSVYGLFSVIARSSALAERRSNLKPQTTRLLRFARNDNINDYCLWGLSEKLVLLTVNMRRLVERKHTFKCLISLLIELK
jgi:hypothetical protein